MKTGTRLGEDIEALHDMRVATRRLRAAFEVFSDAFEPQVMKPYLKGLRATGRALGSVRDLDVFMEKAQRYIDKLPEGERGGLEPLLGQWQGQRAEARARMLEHLNSWEYASFKQKFNLFLHTPGMGACPQPPDQPAPERVCELAPVLIYSRIAAARAYAPWLADAPVERLHMLRIEFKKLRYTVEYFSEVLGKRSVEVINALKQIQDHLGDLNDAQVATQIIGGFIEGWDSAAASATHPGEAEISKGWSATWQRGMQNDTNCWSLSRLPGKRISTTRPSGATWRRRSRCFIITQIISIFPAA